MWCACDAARRRADGAEVSEEKTRLHTALLAASPLPAELFAEEAFYKVGGPGRARVCGAQATCNADVPAQPYRLARGPTTTTSLSDSAQAPPL